MHKKLTKMNVDERKVELTLRLYVDPADQDYLAARSAYGNALFYVFYWCAAQACEKYMKAFLLLQNESTQDYRHDLIALFDNVCKFDRDNTIPEIFDLPETSAMGRESWQNKPLRLYIDYLNTYGSSDNRYAFRGTFVNGPVLHALDILCCSLRQAMRRNNFMCADLFEHRSNGLAPHERIQNPGQWMIDPSLLLENLAAGRYSVGQDKSLRSMFHNMNFAFFTERLEGENSFGGQHFHGSPLFNHLVRLAKIDNSKDNVDTVNELRDWAARNVQMTKSVRAALNLPDYR